jgi:hypothetical protein
MIIHKVDIGRLAILESKNDSPVRPHGHGPKAFEIAFKGVQAESWQSQRVDSVRRVQYSQYLPQFAHMLGTYASCILVLEKLPQPFVPEAFDH